MARLNLGETPLGLADVARLLGGPTPVLALDPAAVPRIKTSRAAVDRAVREGRVCYGINTGFGRLANVVVPPPELRRLQVNLVRSHAAGVGPPLDEGVCRLAFALRITNLCRGYSGVRPALVEHALSVFNAGIVPILPSQGSVGASGDLAPLAHMALVLLGEGRAWRRGRAMDGARALEAAGIAPLRLAAKEGLALMNGTQVSTALLADAVLTARRLACVADIACALTLEAYKGTDSAFDARIHGLRGQPGQQVAASNLRRLLAGSRILPSHEDCPRVQDPYSLRCAPQVHGASRDVLAYAEAVLLAELHAVTDNPLVLDGEDIVSGGNFHAQPVGMAADALKLAAAEWASISERRTELLVNPDLSGLPAFLARKGGVQSGLMIAQVAAAALVSENKVLAHPASVDSIPTSAGKEDHVSMAPAAARQCRQILANATNVLAIELMAGFHALAFETKLRAGKGVEAARRALRPALRPLREDRVLSTDIEAVAGRIEDGTLLDAVEKAVGALD
ncbi:MAG: histidine ammonia-lyase [Planctomycetota bacterium]